MKTAVIILGHGSRSGSADGQLKRIAAEVKKNSGAEMVVEYAFLQYMKPGLEEVLERCVRQGVQSLVIVPFFLQCGTHVMKDIPALIEKAKKVFPGVSISVTDFVGSHPLMASIVLGLLKQSGRSE